MNNAPYLTKKSRGERVEKIRFSNTVYAGPLYLRTLNNTIRGTNRI